MYLPILTYHRLLAEEPTKTRDPKRIAVSQAQFRRHLLWLHRLGFRTLALSSYVDRLAQSPAPEPRRFGITFDDAYEEVLTLALPLLKAFGFQATVFAVPGETHNRWDDGRARLMTPEQLRRWREAGMEVGSHTTHHVRLPQVSLEQARDELRGSKERLEQILGRPVDQLAYPYGESTPAVEQAAQEAGYRAAFATDRAPKDHAENPFRLRRAVVFPRNNAWEILWKAQRWYPAYQDWKRS